MNVGTGEIIMLAIILVIVFSASQMGVLGNALGRFVYSFKKASQGDGFIDAKATRIDRPRDRGTEDAQITEKQNAERQNAEKQNAEKKLNEPPKS